MARPEILTERQGDAPAVRQINELAFPDPLEADLVDALRGTEEIISLVATIDDRVLGHIMFTTVRVTPADPALRVAGLGPMAVHPAFQRQGIGGALIRAGLDACRQRGYGAVVVVGHPEYYPRFGFMPAHWLGLKYEHDDVPEQAFMVLELTPGVLTGAPAVVRYRREFTTVEESHETHG